MINSARSPSLRSGVSGRAQIIDASTLLSINPELAEWIEEPLTLLGIGQTCPSKPVGRSGKKNSFPPEADPPLEKKFPPLGYSNELESMLKYKNDS